jgi:F0F1-type ATP synthase assembly protein I
MDVLDDDGKDVDYSSGQVSELCQNLYMASARCDMHYRSWNNKAKQSKQYAQVMNLQCDFIDSVVAGNFDELGFVKLDQENITNPTGLSGLIQKTFSLATSPNAPPSVVTPLQIFGLCASVFACCILGLWAAALHKGKSVAVTGWRPKRRNIGSAREITRQDSGIMMGRSEDGSTYQAPK